MTPYVKENIIKSSIFYHSSLNSVSLENNSIVVINFNFNNDSEYQEAIYQLESKISLKAIDVLDDVLFIVKTIRTMKTDIMMPYLSKFEIRRSSCSICTCLLYTSDAADEE